MKKLWVVVLFCPILVGCLGQSQATQDINALYTEAAKTVAVQLTQAYTPEPTFTATSTSIPTETPTATVEPSPTVPAPTSTWTFNAAGKVLAPILLYNHISDDLEDNPYYQWEAHMDISSADFHQQMMILKEAGYTAIPLSLLVDGILNGANLPPRPIVITFDATSPGIYRKAFPIMKEMGWVGTIFIVANQLDGDGTLTTSQVKEMIAAGWEVGSKGLNSVNLTLDYSVLQDEIFWSKSKLEEKLGVTINFFSYPGGITDAAVSQRVSEWGYRAAVGLLWYDTSEHTLASLYYLSRFEVKNGWTPEEFIAILPWKPDVVPTQVPTTAPPVSVP
jgi:peptidoglycan/xylan/chitin deacetylase (PgdA/CDA1 family)